jgi:UDP-N-acetylmuramate dehydrogenase
MGISENISLKPFNSFGIDAYARYFAFFHSLSQLEECLASPPSPSLLVLGGGSNILLTKNIDGLVLKNAIRGIEMVREDDEHYYVKAAAGENWHAFVQYCLGHNYAGLENLSLIPGNVGASPMQNIGAYGVEIKDVFEELEAWHLQEKTVQVFKPEDCAFGYRESIFKNRYREQFIILNVTFRLRKKPVFHTNYGAIQQELDKMGVTELSIQAISEAVIRIRSSKLPDPAVIGNAGSFFKNPVISHEHFLQLREQYAAIPGFAAGDRLMKVPAGWLIEQCGWKGFRKGDAGCYEKQALVLVNYGQATGNEIYLLSASIIESVSSKFNITLEREVNIM